MYSADGQQHGWAVLMGGGSLPELGAKLDAALLAAIVRMTPADLVTGDRQWCLAEAGANYLVYSADAQAIALDLSAAKGEFAVQWIEPQTGRMTAAASVTGGQKVTLQPPRAGPVAVWLTQSAGQPMPATNR
jgi:hypothetical protein